MRVFLPVIAVLGITTAAAAEPDTNMMNVMSGPWTMKADDGATCALTLGDEHIKSWRYLDGGGGCRRLDPLFEQATGWRIDKPGELVFVTDTGKALLKMRYIDADETFQTSEDHDPTLTLVPTE